jgi:hypothetical protein
LIAVPSLLRLEAEKKEIETLDVDETLKSLEFLDGQPPEVRALLTDLGLEYLRHQDEGEDRECVLGCGHPGPHYAWLGEEDLVGLWLRWTQEAEAEPVAIPYCGEFYDPDHPGGDGECCLAFKGHPGPHRWGFVVEWETEHSDGDAGA